MLTTLLIMSIVIGPPTISFGTTGPGTILVEYAYLQPFDHKQALIMKLHNPGGSRVYIIEIDVNNKKLPTPTFTNPLIINAGESTEVSYLIPPVKNSNRIHVVIKYVPETMQNITKVDVYIQLFNQTS